ncbi:chromosome condensation protein CrcB [haloarchaeon 3A1-DGR]|nr:chromosome condensation protein CrcB [haloarchaeon 3A1-DGR]
MFLDHDRGRALEVALLIAIGGFVGGVLRHAIADVVVAPGGTLAANVLGCLALGFLTYEAELAGTFAEETGYVLSTGFLSSFTTYSTFALETMQAAPLLGVGNVVANYGLGAVAVLLGRSTAMTVTEERAR